MKTEPETRTFKSFVTYSRTCEQANRLWEAIFCLEPIHLQPVKKLRDILLYS